MSSVKRSRRTAIAATAAVLLALPLLFLSPPASLALKPLQTSALDWNKAAGGGFGTVDNEDVYTLQAYGPYLYAGTYNLNGCELWRYDGAEWVNIVGSASAGPNSPGFGDPNNDMLSGMAVFGDMLYMGTSNGNGCEVWRYDGTSLSKLVGAGNPGDYGPGFGSADNEGVRGMQVFKGKLYIGTDNYGAGCEVWRYDGTSLSKLVGAGNPGDYGSGFGNGQNATAHSMGIYGGDLVIGTWNINQGCEVWSYDGTSLAQLAGDAAAPGAGFGNVNNYMAATIREFGGRMFVGTSNYSGCEVWSYDSSTWTKEVGAGLAGERGPGFGNAANEDAFRSQVFGPYFFYATYNPAFGAQVWRYDGSFWAMECTGGITDGDNQGIECFALYGAGLYLGTYNPVDGAEVWSASYSFYFAEGYTGAGFQEYLCLGNPQGADADVVISYMFRDGSVQRQSLTVPANFRATVDVNAAVGPDKDVSCRIDADQPIVAERPMYFDFRGNRGGHVVAGYAPRGNEPAGGS